MVHLSIIHWSDLHFASGPGGLEPDRAVLRATEAIKRDYGMIPFTLAITGDITTRGAEHGYREAIESLVKTKRILAISRVLVCPGNHDISPVRSREFQPFNRFAFEATGSKDQNWNYLEPVAVESDGSYSFISINSAFEGDHRYGSTPIAQLRAALDNTEGTHRILLLHHSPIQSSYAGGGMADAYELLRLASERQVAAVLHGHVHSDQTLSIGSGPTVLYGIGSLGFEPDPNMNNEFAVHSFADGRLIQSDLYRYYRNKDEFERVPH
jgi:3',5'-cyclic AMP phosphodiesterase CpdA